MKTNTQLFIDKYLVQVVVVVLNILVKIAGKVLRIDHSLDRNFKTIAICKYKGMGSIIQATPLLQVLKSNYPDAKIIFVTTPGNKSILEKTQMVDEIICLNDKSVFTLLTGFPVFISRLISRRIEVYIDLEVYSNFSSLVTILSLSKNRLGFYLQSKHYRLGNYTHMMYHNTRSPIHQTYLQFARLMGCKFDEPGLVKLKSHEKSIPDSETAFNLEDTNYLVINPNASDLRLERRWSASNYRQLIIHLLALFPDYYLVIVGGKGESAYVAKLLEGLSDKRIINMAGKTNLEQLIALITNAKTLITNDSGPMHIGFACNTPTVALFGPCSPSQYGHNQNSISIYKNAYCSPCVHDFVNPPCKGNNQCMHLITVNEVIAATKKLLNSTYQPTDKPQVIAYNNNEMVLGSLGR